MCPHVSCQMAALLERVVTNCALVWGFVGMCSHVSCQVAVLSERFVAHCTLEWSFFGVSPHVPCQIAVFIEWLVTHSAFILVGVHFQFLLGCVWFIATCY